MTDARRMMLDMSERANSRSVPDLTLGWRLKMALGDYGAGEIARDLGVTRSTVSRWMADRGARPKAAYLKQWALITRTDYDWLDKGIVTSQPDTDPGGPGSDSGSPDLGPGFGDTAWFPAPVEVLPTARNRSNAERVELLDPAV